MRYVLIIWLFFEIYEYLYFNTRKPPKTNVAKLKQSWIGNVWKYLYTLNAFHLGEEVMFTKHTFIS